MREPAVAVIAPVELGREGFGCRAFAEGVGMVQAGPVTQRVRELAECVA